jgi:excisionase family DNA binding protein
MQGRNQLKAHEIKTAFSAEDLRRRFPPILTVTQVAELVQVSPKTIYFWMARGRLDGAYRKRGKHHLLWRDRVIDQLFNGKEWH